MYRKSRNWGMVHQGVPQLPQSARSHQCHSDFILIFISPPIKAFTPQPDDTSECVSHPVSAFISHSDSSSAEPSEWNFSAALQTSWLESLLDHTPPQEEEERPDRILSEYTNTGLKRQLWSCDTDSRSTDTPSVCPDKKTRLDQEFLDQTEHSSEHPGSETVQVFGSFHGLRVLKAAPSATSDLWKEGRCAFFKTSIREHSTVRTRVFPHGKTFTSHTPDGGCRFLWIPKQN